MPDPIIDQYQPSPVPTGPTADDFARVLGAIKPYLDKSQIVQGIVNGLSAPHDAWVGKYDAPPEPTNEEDYPAWRAAVQDKQNQAIQGAFDTAAFAGTGSLAAPASERGSLGVFLGPYGLNRLKQQGVTLPEHPSAIASLKYGEPLIKDQGMREAQAQGSLAMRQAAALPEDPSTFYQSGWSMGADGMPRREIPDIGAQLKPVFTEGGDPIAQNGGFAFKWDHPTGNLHQAYGVPYVTVQDAGKKQWGASFSPDSGQIVIRSNPFTDKGMNYANKVIPHEFQHAIQHVEGFSPGSNPVLSPLYKEYWEQQGVNPNSSLEKEMLEHRISMNLFGGAPESSYNIYKRSMGETEARNVQARRGAGYNYLQHPSLTEDVPRNQQLLSYFKDARPRNLISSLNVPNSNIESMLQALLNPPK